MRPDDRVPFDDLMDGGMDLPFDAALEALDQELAEAGAHARRSLHGRTQPTRVFANDLRARLVGAIAAPVAVVDAAALLPRDSARGPRQRPELVEAGEAWAPTPLQPRIANRTPQVLPRARWSLLAAAALTLVVVAGALGARPEWLFPTPTNGPSDPPASAAPGTPKPTDRASAAPVILPVNSTAPTLDPTQQPTATPAPTSTPKPTPTPTPTPKPTPRPTDKPEPTKPPIGAMDLALKACPGGVLIDWTKPSPEVGHYHALRSLEGDVAPTYPAPGATEFDSGTSWSAGITDAFDASVGGGKTASYRVFAFDGGDELMAFSPSRTVTTQARLSMGALGVVDNGPGSITVSWNPASVPSACFTYGKLVVSKEDPEPSYLKGSTYLAAISDQTQSSVLLEDLESGTTFFMRYEYIRVTGTGKFVVAITDVASVTIP